MTKDPLVSIVTPSFNKGNFIDETIRSVLDQSYPNIEFIVIDGGSTDETLSILERYRDRICWMSEPDKGQSDAINKGWRMATGEIIAYLNADDTYLPNAVESVVSFFEAHPEIGLVYGDGILEDDLGRKIADYIAGPYSLENLIFCRDNILQPSVFFRRHLLKTVGFLDESLHLAMDLDYWIRVGLVDEITYLPQLLSAAKIYQDAKSSAFLTQYVGEYERILEKVFRHPALPSHIIEKRSRIYSSMYTKAGLDFLKKGQYRAGCSYLTKGFCQNPVQATRSSFSLSSNYFWSRFNRDGRG